MGSDVYMIGDGKMGAYLSGGDIVQLFGPPYSSPSVMETAFINTDGYTKTQARHRKRAGIWQFHFMKNGACAATVTDFALPGEACLVRRIESTDVICMRVRPFREQGSLFSYETTEQTDGGTLKILLKTKRGNAVYNDYPLPFPQFFTILIRGDAYAEHTADFSHDIYVNGKAEILFIGGPSYPECDAAAGRIAGMKYDDMLAAAIGRWEEIFDRLSAPLSLPKGFPRKESCEAAMEDTVLNLVSQQSGEGGVLSGYTGHMAYVRDQFGVFRGMLSLGLFEQAHKMLLFYAEVFKENGQILNAQAMGVRGMFHFAENDNSEITGYLLWQFLYYAKITGDTQILRENIGMLLWLYDRQAGELADGMMPFNGDETYIAGGLLPRDVINDGSAEATMLYIMSGRALLEFLKNEGLLSKVNAAQMDRDLSNAERKCSCTVRKQATENKR